MAFEAPREGFETEPEIDAADWLRTARNLVKFSGADNSYKDVEQYLKRVRKL